MRIALLLRGVNVGGVTVRSADLRALLADAGMGEVATVLASGNAVVTATDASAAAEVAEAALAARYGRRIRVLGIAIDVLADVVADYPHAEDDEHTPYVVFELEPGVAVELAQLEPGAGESIAAGKRGGTGVVHWSNPKGTTLTSPFARALERTANDRVTTRNLRTLRKVLAAA
ncbi:Uncharacterized conserved protein, DUF1697 family [Agrococcus baldri]|uniref:Uncharacterized conserved protein, DUF1697 family n=1 Tax=Agrococcus baldri TaxID=153730 RepID=A0AA94L101_9MICO|nr:DUF1697 domain-containing protein [Agrococcus baldri]SFS19023.1 Uncharacterized conserved protein, DUF1697 family [Agrococcus baldri]